MKVEVWRVDDSRPDGLRACAAEALDDDFLVDPGDHDITVPGSGVALDCEDVAGMRAHLVEAVAPNAHEPAGLRVGCCAVLRCGGEHRPALRFGDRSVSHALVERCFVEHSVAPEVRGVPAVLGAVREVLRNGDVVHLEAPAGRAVRVGAAYGDEAVLPATRHGGGGGDYTVDLESVGLVERAVSAEGARDEFGRLGLVRGEDVDFLGDEELGGGLGEGPEDGLAADDDEGRFARMAWLPMMMRVVSPVRSATARMACSSSWRVTAAAACRRGAVP